MSKVQCVIGAMYGDEGKGLMTDYFASQHIPDVVVIRYNSSAQAGHTVVCPGKIRHVFSHFGSGSFAMRPTILSEHFVVHPVLFKKEYQEFRKKALLCTPKVYVHTDCMVTTPYEMIINQIIENRRGKDRHGSVGIGFGETFERQCYMTLHVSDLFGDKDDLRQKLMLIRDRWVPSRIQDCQSEDEQRLFEALNSDIMLDNFMEDCNFFINTVFELDYDQFQHCDLIFEGAQGLMLDQTFGFFPHVTRSNTGLKNIIEVLKNFTVDELKVNHISRAYTTRHGAGPLEFEMDFPNHIIDNTNHSHIFQGSLRYSPLNVDDLHDVITKDYESVKDLHSYDIIDEVTITCLNQLLDEVSFINNGKLQIMTKDKFLGGIKQTSTYTSFGPTREHILKV